MLGWGTTADPVGLGLGLGLGRRLGLVLGLGLGLALGLGLWLGLGITACADDSNGTPRAVSCRPIGAGNEHHRKGGDSCGAACKMYHSPCGGATHR